METQIATSECPDCAATITFQEAPPNIQRPREIISTAAGHNQSWQIKADQCRKMTMDRTFSAEDNDCIGVFRKLG